MAPLNEAGKPANPGETKRTPHNVVKPVVPALPLGFPQRPVSMVKQATPLAHSVVARSQPVASAIQRAVDPVQPLAASAKNEENHNGAPLREPQPVQQNGASSNASLTEPMHQQGRGMKAPFCMLLVTLSLLAANLAIFLSCIICTDIDL